MGLTAARLIRKIRPFCVNEVTKEKEYGGKDIQDGACEFRGKGCQVPTQLPRVRHHHGGDKGY
jgi:hypothetical protein